MVRMGVRITSRCSNWMCCWCDGYWSELDDRFEIGYMSAGLLVEQRTMLLVIE